jgi:hypothetical protein
MMSQITKQSPIKIEVTGTTDFLLPLLGKPKQFYVAHLLNAYLKNTSYDTVQDYLIHIVLKFSGKSTFKTITDYLSAHQFYRGEYELLHGELCCYLMEIPDNFKKDYDAYLRGKYSEFSPEGQRLVLAARHPNSAIPSIFSKGELLVQHWYDRTGVILQDHNEVWPIWSEKKEYISNEALEDLYKIPSTNHQIKLLTKNQ